jgi:hypothetical protein
MVQWDLAKAEEACKKVSVRVRFPASAVLYIGAATKGDAVSSTTAIP